MTDTSTPSTERPSHPPLWLVEGLDIVEQRRSVLLAVVIGVIALGGLLAVVAPGIVPPVPVVGAAVGVAALLLGLAVAIALDATDLRLRGPRHVGAAGGELVAVLPTRAGRDGADTLADAVLAARMPGSPLLLGLAASGRDIRPTVAWTDALATALVAGGVSVLRIDLASGHTRSDGLLEVVRDGVKLASAVTFGPEPKLARLGAGADLAAALEALSALPGRLPRDLDVLLVALPMAATRPVVTAVRSLDHVLIVAQRDRTSRVELIAGLDAMEAAGTRAQVALLDDRTAARLAPRSAAAPSDTTADVADDATADAKEPAGAQPPGVQRPEPSAATPTDAGDAEPEQAPVAVGEPPEVDGAGKPDRPEPSERREVEVVDGAAEATAVALVQLPVELPFDPDDGDDDPAGALPVGEEVAPPADSVSDLPPAPVDLDPSAERAAPAAADIDHTDEIPVVETPGEVTDAEVEHDEMMQTTAQLSVLLDDLDGDGDERPSDTP
jgi:hypothetical protein